MLAASSRESGGPPLRLLPEPQSNCCTRYLTGAARRPRQRWGLRMLRFTTRAILRIDPHVLVHVGLFVGALVGAGSEICKDYCYITIS